LASPLIPHLDGTFRELAALVARDAGGDQNRDWVNHGWVNLNSHLSAGLGLNSYLVWGYVVKLIARRGG
jgi:hypothetical protein